MTLIAPPVSDADKRMVTVAPDARTRACDQLAVSVGGCHPDAALGG